MKKFLLTANIKKCYTNEVEKYILSKTNYNNVNIYLFAH